MTHVQIRMDSESASIVVDGVDITKQILANSLAVEFGEIDRPSLVHLTLVADRVDIDLPDAVVDIDADEPATRTLCEPAPSDDKTVAELRKLRDVVKDFQAVFERRSSLHTNRAARDKR